MVMGGLLVYRAEDAAPRLALGLSTMAALVMLAMGDDLWRVALCGGTFAIGCVLAWRRARAMDAWSYGLVVTAQTCLITATGAMHSPLVPALLPPMFVASLTLRGAQRRTLAAMPIALLAMAALTLSDHPAGEPSRAFGHPVVWVVMFPLVVLAAGVTGVSSLQLLTRQVRDSRAREVEALSHRANDLRLLTATLGHELKNPLAAIQGLSTLLAQGDPADRTTVRARVIAEEADRMRTRLDELLGLTRPLGPLQLATVDPTTLVSELVEAHRGMAMERGVRLEATLSSTAVVRADPSKLRSALVNLLQNAIEASPEGTVVEVFCPSEGAFVIADRGPGLAPQVRDSLFAHGTTTKAKGSGLGLVISRAIAQQHGGNVRLDDRSGGGCEAHLWIA